MQNSEHDTDHCKLDGLSIVLDNIFYVLESLDKKVAAKIDWDFRTF